MTILVFLLQQNSQRLVDDLSVLKFLLCILRFIRGKISLGLKLYPTTKFEKSV